MKNAIIVLVLVSLLIMSGCNNEKSSSENSFNNIAEKETFCKEKAYEKSSDGYYSLNAFYDEKISKMCNYVIIAQVSGVPTIFKNMLDFFEDANEQERQMREIAKEYKTSPENTYYNTITEDRMYWDKASQKWIVVGNT